MGRNLLVFNLFKSAVNVNFNVTPGVEAPELERGGYAYIYSKQECCTTVNVIDQNTGLYFWQSS